MILQVLSMDVWLPFPLLHNHKEMWSIITANDLVLGQVQGMSAPHGKTASSPMFFGGITSLPNDGAAAVVEELDVAGSSGGSLRMHRQKSDKGGGTLGDLNDLLIDLSCNWGVALWFSSSVNFTLARGSWPFWQSIHLLKKIPNNSEIPQPTDNKFHDFYRRDPIQVRIRKKTYTLKSSKSPRLFKQTTQQKTR